MRTTNTPARLWDYCWSYICELRTLTATDHIYLDGVTPYEKVHGYSPNISEFLTHKWYDWIWYHDPASPIRSELGRWLGPAHDATQGMAYHVLTQTGEVLTRSTVHKLNNNDKISVDVKRRQEDYTTSMESNIGNYALSTIHNSEPGDEASNIYENIFEDLPHEKECIDVEYDLYGDHVYNIEDIVDASSNQTSSELSVQLEDKLLGIELELPLNGEMQTARINKRKRGTDGTLIGEQNRNPFFDTRVYEVDFGDGNYYEYSANIILENLYSQVDDFGRSTALLSDIVGHRKNDDAIPKSKGWYQLHGTAAKKRIITTKGWEFHVEWSDGTRTWVPLLDLKESNPVDLAEYAVSRSIADEPALAWWVNWTLKKKERIIKLVQNRVPKKGMKFGIVVPGSVKEALRLDHENGNDLWSKAIDKELKNVLVAFKLLQEDENVPVGSKLIPYHIIFDVKFDLTRKARLVAEGHRNKNIPAHATYSSVASRDSVRLGFLLAGLNDLDIMACDIGNAYLNAPNRERVHVIVGKELFGPEHEGKKAIIVRALYGLKSASAAWRHHFFQTITQKLEYKSTIADPDVYIKAKCKSDGSKYYSYLIIYVDDVLCIDVNPGETIEKIKTVYRVKPESVKTPDMYLGMDIRKWKIQDDEGRENDCYAIGANSYVREAIRIIKARLDKPDVRKKGIILPTSKKSGSMPFTSQSYRPELDSTDYCDQELHTLFQNIIGMLRWMCELGRIDILHETSLLSQYLAQPRLGHLNQAINIFHYLDKHNRSWMVLDPTRFDIVWKPKNNELSPEIRAMAMKDQYPDAEELIPHNAPEPLGKEVDINVFVDADHAENRITRRSHTGIIIYCNMCPISWYSKRQTTVETSTFSSEIIALRIATEQVEALRYKLRMFGVPLSGPARVFCDNESVVNVTSNVEARLKKKHASVSYGKIKSALAASVILVYYESTKSNIADLLTKVLSVQTRVKLIKSILN